MAYTTANSNSPTLLQEIFKEADAPCKNKDCQCSHCKQDRQKVRSQLQELNWNLSGEEEYELSKAFQKIKSLAKKTYRRVKPMIVTADIIRRIIFPPTDPIPQIKNIATYTEQSKKRKREEDIEKAQSATKDKGLQKPPDGETTILQEIFMEADEEMPKGRWSCNDVRCNVYPDPQATVANNNCPKRVIGSSSGYSSYTAACRAAQKSANSKVPQGCVKRHCNCKTKCNKV